MAREVKKTKLEKLTYYLERPYVKLPILIAILTTIGTASMFLVLLIASTYALAEVVGIPTLQLVTGIVSAMSAVASASAAILIWRGNVVTRKTILIDRVLGPAYSEVRRSRELLESWRSEAREIALSTPFLDRVPSDWLYYTLEQLLRAELESLQGLIQSLEEQKELCKNIASAVIRIAASKMFGVKDSNTVYLWQSHSWSQDQPTGRTGRTPSWELMIDAPPLRAPPGYYVHALQIIDHDQQRQAYSMPLLSQDKTPLNANEFEQFWELARKLVATEEAIVTFRETCDKVRELCTGLERKLNSEIKRLR